MIKLNRSIRQIIVRYFRRELSPINEIKTAYSELFSEISESFVELVKTSTELLASICFNIIVCLMVIPFALYGKIKLTYCRYLSSRKVKKYGMWGYIDKVVKDEIEL